jgi:hypothetical protein
MNTVTPHARQHIRSLMKASRREARAVRRRDFWARLALPDLFSRASLRGARSDRPVGMVSR